MQPGRSLRRRQVFLGCLAGIGGLALLVVGVLAYFGLREWRAPSGGVVVETQQGAVELDMPLELVAPPAGAGVDLTGRTPQPPRTVEIPRIGVRADVFVMADKPPNFPAVGWLFGTAMPGSAGNLVLYGARGGQAAVFTALDELRPGDGITVATGDVAFVYQVTTSEVVDAGQTELLLPTTEPMVTLITEAGKPGEANGSQSQRLVVRGRYVDARAWSGL